MPLQHHDSLGRTSTDVRRRLSVFLSGVIMAAVSSICDSQIPTNLQSCVSTSGNRQVCVPPTFDPLDSLSTTISATSTCGMSGTILEFCAIDRTDNSSGCSLCRSSTEYRPDRVRTRSSEFERWQSATLPTIETAENLTATFASGYILLSVTIEFPVPVNKPSDMIIQGQSADGWRLWLHLSRDCSTSPHWNSVTGAPCRNFDLTTNVESYTRTTISALNASLASEGERAKFTRQYGGQWGVQLAFLHGRYNDLVGADNRHLSAFYSVTHLVVDALCNCNGHASACSAEGACSCQHGTEGLSCERCIPNNGPYRLATYVEGSADVCTRDINDCANSPCLNGAACVDGINNYTCNCTHGFTGQHCMTNINECASSPCSNGGTCVDLLSAYTCKCAAGFTGELCETRLRGAVSDGGNDMGLYIAITFAGFFLLLFLHQLLLNWRRRQMPTSLEQSTQVHNPVVLELTENLAYDSVGMIRMANNFNSMDKAASATAHADTMQLEGSQTSDCSLDKYAYVELNN